MDDVLFYIWVAISTLGILIPSSIVLWREVLR
jgi:hypothetical protein